VNLSYKTRYFTSANVIKAHAIDQDRVYGNFYQKANAFQNQQKEVKSDQEAPLRARVDKFVTYVHNHPELGVTNLVDANRNDLSTMSQIMEMYIKIGLYKEA
jgi:methyltransferase-like protein